MPILWNPDNSRCPNGCFRPVGLAWDPKGRLFMTSDRSGEIFVVGKADGGAVDAQTLEVTAASGSGSGSGSQSEAIRVGGASVVAVLVAAFVAMMI